MVVPTGSNLYSEGWNIIHAVISGNVTDPILSTRAENQTGSTWIFGAFPDMEARNRPHFPVIIIDNPEADSEFQTFSTAGNIEKNVTFSVWAYAKDNRTVNVLADDISDAFQANRAKLGLSGLQLRGLNAGAAGTDILANQRVHYRETQAKCKIVVPGA